MKSVIWTNEKGGQGKSTGVLHLGGGMALRDLRVLLIDGDAQGHLGHQLDLKPFGGLYRLLAQGAAWDDVLREPALTTWCGRQGTIGTLHVVQSNYETALIPMAISDLLVLRKRLAEVSERFDVVIIDTPPTPSLLHSVLFFASDAVIYPTKCEELSLYGLGETQQHMIEHDAMRRGYGLKAVKLLGVLPTMYRDTLSHEKGLELLTNHFGANKIWAALPQRTIWTEREWEHQTLHVYAPEHEATREFDVVIGKVMAYAS